MAAMGTPAPDSPHFEGLEEVPQVVLWELMAQHAADPCEQKVNLTIGAYRTDDGEPFVLPCVREAKQRLLGDPTQTHEYLPIDGLDEFREAARTLLFGERELSFEDGGRVATVQTLSGTGALRLAFSFLARNKPDAVVFAPEPTWSNHGPIVTQSGLALRQYRYFNDEAGTLDEQGMFEDLRAAPEGSILLLHTCAHNPTGRDPTPEQWAEIGEICKTRGLLCVFDSAYLGFASGDLQRDIAPLTHFVDTGLEIFVAMSFSKNFGLYGERIGALLAVVKDTATARAMQSQLKVTVRSQYSNPPTFGARVVSTVLNDPALKASWLESLADMANRITAVRTQLKTELENSGARRDWSRLVDQIGMFSFTGLNAEQVARLKDEFHIYLLPTGRASMAGLTSGNVSYVAAAFKAVTEP